MKYEYQDCWKDTSRESPKYSERPAIQLPHKLIWNRSRATLVERPATNRRAMPGRDSNGVHHAWDGLKIRDNLHALSLKFIFRSFPFVLSRITYCIHLCLWVGVSTVFASLWLVTVCSSAATLLAWLSLLTQLTSSSTHSARDWKYSCIRKNCNRTAF
jgi:hypothetical protein